MFGMTTSSHVKRAAQYVRMSTEHQQYSTANQRDAISAYAAVHDIEIVATYEDAGKSGLTLSGRPALRRLIADAVGGQNVFDMILVYDISRWGRFQDADQSAYLEYLCRLAGVRVEYCAEPFANDGSPFSSIFKVVKRALAAEYSRELSNKVDVGKRRLIGLGFHQAGSAGYGLRRCLVDKFGARKGWLARGEHKSIATDRVILVPGPPEEVAIVRRIYRDCTKRGMSCCAIADSLNREGVKSESGRPWSRAAVKQILTSEKYLGNNVWGRESFKLKLVHQHNPPEAWARFDGAFEGIVGRRLFAQAQKRLIRPKQPSDEEILARLQEILRSHGEISTRLIAEDTHLDIKHIGYRFGGLVSAYARIGYKPRRDFAFLAWRKAAQALRAATAQALEEGVITRGGTIRRIFRDSRFIINEELAVSVIVAQQQRTHIGNPRWRVKLGGAGFDLTIALLTDEHHELAGCYLFPASAFGDRLVLTPHNALDVDAFRFNDLERVLQICSRSELATEIASTSRYAYFAHEPSGRPSTAPKSAKIQGRRPRTLLRRSATERFVESLISMRVLLAKADTAHDRVEMLRSVLARLLIHARFVRVLMHDNICSVPLVTSPDDVTLRAERVEMFEAHLRERVRKLLSEKGLTPHAMAELSKLTETRKLASAEFMVLANDPTQYLARALVWFSPLEGLQEYRHLHIREARSKRLRPIIEGSTHLYRDAKRALGEYGHDALDLVALEAFVRRLLASPSVVGWLERHDMNALQELNTH